MTFINYNGLVTDEKQVRISPDNRAFRYADGFFETMRLINGQVVLQNLHFERLFASLDQLKFKVDSFPTHQVLLKQIVTLAERNACLSSGRVRLTIFAGDGNLSDNHPRIANYIIQTSALQPPSYVLNEKGISVNFYHDAIKTADNYSFIKSNNFLPYVMASLWAKENKLDDAILLNPFKNVADATIANIFIVKDGFIKTPPLTDGPINGVMRKYLLQSMRNEGMPCQEISITKEDVFEASEVFLTNAIFGIKWVEKIGINNYTSQMSALLFKKFISILNK